MARCTFCKKETGYLPFHCKYCGNSFCSEHRLPENHNCTFEIQFKKIDKNLREEPIINKKIEEKKVKEFSLKPKLQFDDDSVVLKDQDFILIKHGHRLVVDVYRDPSSPFILPDQMPPIGIIRKIWNFIENSKEKKFNAILIELLDNLSEYNFNLVPEEIKFLLDWSIEEEKYGLSPYMIHLTLSERQKFENKKVEITGPTDPNGEKIYYYPFNPTSFHYTTLNQPDYIFTDQSSISMYRGHISGLVIQGALELPESLGNLSRLKFLCITDVALKSLPHSFNNLKNLRYLYFYNTELEGFPEIVTTFPKLRGLGLQGIKLDYIPEMVKEIAYKYYSRTYIKEGVSKDDANILGLLEVLTGIQIVPFDIAWCTATLPTHYQFNEQGKITSLWFNDPTGVLPLTYIPEELQKLEYLEELIIETLSEDKITIPESLKSFLKSIKFEFYQN
jgi:hypothetical protein